MKSAVTRIVSVSPALQRWLRATGGMASDMIPNAIDTERFRDRGAAARAVFGIPAGVPVLAYAGRLTRKKGSIGQLVLEAFDQELGTTFPGSRLLIAGNGDDAAALEAAAKRSKAAERIRCLGYVEDMPAFYSTANVVIGTGRIALEAMSCERVVVAVGVNEGRRRLGDASVIRICLAQLLRRSCGGLARDGRRDGVDGPPRAVEPLVAARMGESGAGGGGATIRSVPGRYGFARHVRKRMERSVLKRGPSERGTHGHAQPYYLRRGIPSFFQKLAVDAYAG